MHMNPIRAMSNPGSMTARTRAHTFLSREFAGIISRLAPAVRGGMPSPSIEFSTRDRPLRGGVCALTNPTNQPATGWQSWARHAPCELSLERKICLYLGTDASLSFLAENPPHPFAKVQTTIRRPVDWRAGGDWNQCRDRHRSRRATAPGVHCL